MPHHTSTKEPLNNQENIPIGFLKKGLLVLRILMSVLSKVPLEELQKFSHRLMPGTAAHEELMWEIERRKKRRDLAYDISVGVAIIMTVIVFAIACYVNI